MATYTYKKCPHCGKTYESYSTYTKNFQGHSGSPFITCRSCGRTFVDKEIKEPALKPYTGEGFELWRCFFAFLMPFGLLGILALVCAINSEEYAFAASIFSIIFFGIYIALTTYTIRNRVKFIAEDRKEYFQSEKRLQNPLYAKALKDAGFDVPKKYLETKENSIDALTNLGNHEKQYVKVNDTSNNRMYSVCIFDKATHTLRKEKKQIDITKFPPSRFADNDTYYAIETFRDGKKIRIYHTKDNWNKQIEIGISEEEK